MFAYTCISISNGQLQEEKLKKHSTAYSDLHSLGILILINGFSSNTTQDYSSWKTQHLTKEAYGVQFILHKVT